MVDIISFIVTSLFYICTMLIFLLVAVYIVSRLPYRLLTWLFNEDKDK